MEQGTFGMRQLQAMGLVDENEQPIIDPENEKKTPEHPDDALPDVRDLVERHPHALSRRPRRSCSARPARCSTASAASTSRTATSHP
jgi:hypothetical protein